MQGAPMPGGEADRPADAARVGAGAATDERHRPGGRGGAFLPGVIWVHRPRLEAPGPGSAARPLRYATWYPVVTSSPHPPGLASVPISVS